VVDERSHVVSQGGGNEPHCGIDASQEPRERTRWNI
jgi:hypothetical protein